MREESMARYTTLGVGGKTTVREIYAVKELAELPDGNVVLGGGSNVLIGETKLPVFAVNKTRGRKFYGDKAYFASGEKLSAICRAAAERGLGGMEWAAGLPGTAGGAVAGNAGTAYGDMASAVDYVDISRDGRTERLSAEECGFSYRSSALNGATVIGVGLKFLKRSRADIERLERAALALRKNQPKGRSAGCVFKNPPGMSAGKILDELGLKGKRRGGAMISPVHANFIVNDGGASPRDVYYLICYAEEKLFEKLGFALQREVKIYGEF